MHLNMPTKSVQETVVFHLLPMVYKKTKERDRIIKNKYKINVMSVNKNSPPLCNIP